MSPDDLKALRKELSCTAKELAHALDLEQGTVLAWEKGEHCRVAPERFRLLEEVLVCAACGRSEEVPGLDLSGAALEEVG